MPDERPDDNLTIASDCKNPDKDAWKKELLEWIDSNKKRIEVENDMHVLTELKRKIKKM